MHEKPTDGEQGKENNAVVSDGGVSPGDEADLQ